MKPFALGLMSGTSADGVSAVLVTFEKNKFKLIDYETFSYSKNIREKILNSARLTTPEISSLNFRLGYLFAESALKLIKKNKIEPKKISVIGSHGQTIFHDPEGNPSNTFQIGEPSVIAEKTGVTVVSDFRMADIAAGGEGAPLIPFFDQYFFGNSCPRAMQNIGGIGNVTVVGKNIKPMAFDTGPGNCLMDWVVRIIRKEKLLFDKNGEMARKGNVILDIVRKMAKHPYFAKKPPKSTGRELFNENFLPVSLKNLIQNKPYDALNTLTYFTAFTIAESYKKFIFPEYKIEEIVVSGGGALNQTLMDELKKILSPIKVYSIEKFGIPVQAKEPIAFAFYAWRAIKGKMNHLPFVTGAKKSVFLGKIIPGKNFKGIRELNQI